MSRSSILAAAIMFFGLAAFVVLVSGGPSLSRGPAPAEAEVRLATGSVVVIEEGAWVTVEQASPGSPSLVPIGRR